MTRTDTAALPAVHQTVTVELPQKRALGCHRSHRELVAGGAPISARNPSLRSSSNRGKEGGGSNAMRTA